MNPPVRRRPFNPVFWTLANIGSRVRYVPKTAAGLTTAELPPEQRLTIPTRHGALDAVVVRPTPPDDHDSTTPPEDRDDTTPLDNRDDTTPPVIVQLHGGGFLNRHPEQDRHIARYFAAQLGAVVVLPDYSTAPKVRYPVAEEETVDIVRWVQESGLLHGWDGGRLFLSGISAGSKLAINACQQLHSNGDTGPLAVSLVVPVTDMSRADRVSSAPRPAISPFVQQLVRWAYFPDAERRRERLAAPRFDTALPDAMPPTIIQTAEYDTLSAEGRELAAVLRTGGVEVRHIEYPGADHDFYSSGPVERVETLLAEITAFFADHLDGQQRLR